MSGSAMFHVDFGPGFGLGGISKELRAVLNDLAAEEAGGDDDDDDLFPPLHDDTQSE